MRNDDQKSEIIKHIEDIFDVINKQSGAGGKNI